MNLKDWQSLSNYFQKEILRRNKEELELIKELEEIEITNMKQYEIVKKHIAWAKKRIRENNNLGLK